MRRLIACAAVFMLGALLFVIAQYAIAAFNPQRISDRLGLSNRLTGAHFDRLTEVLGPNRVGEATVRLTRQSEYIFRVDARMFPPPSRMTDDTFEYRTGWPLRTLHCSERNVSAAYSPRQYETVWSAESKFEGHLRIGKGPTSKLIPIKPCWTPLLGGAAVTGVLTLLGVLTLIFLNRVANRGGWS